MIFNVPINTINWDSISDKCMIIGIIIALIIFIILMLCGIPEYTSRKCTKSKHRYHCNKCKKYAHCKKGINIDIYI